jgi:hypothetical protein
VKAADVSSVVPETVEMRTKTMNVANGARDFIVLARSLVSVLQDLKDRERTEKDTKNYKSPELGRMTEFLDA